MVSVGLGMVVVGAVVFAVVVGCGLLVVRVQNRQFPDGERTGWSEGRSGAAGWFATKATWLSGGRG